MVNEATPVELHGQNNSGTVRRYACADTNVFTKGQVLKLVDARIASGGIVAGDVVAGIACSDKEAGDGSTSIGCWTDGIFEMAASGAIALGAPIRAAENNYIMTAAIGGATAASGAQIIGYILETATSEEVINVRIDI